MATNVVDSFSDVCIAIPFRGGDSYRVRNLQRVLQHYASLSDVEILLVEQDSKPCTLPSLASPVKRLFVHNPGSFNKSWGCNIAVRQSNRALIVLMDADVLIALGALAQAIKLTRTRTFAATPFCAWQDLTLPETETLLNSGSIDFKATHGSTQRREHEQLNFCSGTFVIRREFYLQLGGFDERFLGWGGEDDHMEIKLKRSGQPVGKVEGSVALHLWHPQTKATTFDQPHYASNLKMVQELAACDATQFKFLCELQRQLAGHPHKYELAKHDPLIGYFESSSATA